MQALQTELQLGIAATSFGGALYGSTAAGASAQAKSHAASTVPVIPGAPGVKHADTLEFLERCYALGAAGVQTQINGDSSAVRREAERRGMWLEGMVAVCHSTPEQLESAIVQSKEAGCLCVRDALLSGRRYQNFQSLQEWKLWVSERMQVVERVLPLFEKHRLILALENHKDWTADEYAGLFERFSSEYLRACLDLGNNLALCEEPMQVIEQVAPYVATTHFKDMAVATARDGFAMSEVVLGQGILPLQRIVHLLRRHNPDVRFALEMITRDPLAIPCQSDAYWQTFPERRDVALPKILAYVEAHSSSEPLPTIDQLGTAERSGLETANIMACLRYVSESRLLEQE